MRKNLPVTNIEYPIGDDVLIVSKTDTKGRIVYFNDQFVKASGFSEAELINQPHNIVRHPDMPPEAYEDLWNTLKEGKPWAGAVKNRRKNGDFYWVLASARRSGKAARSPVTCRSAPSCPPTSVVKPNKSRAPARGQGASLARRRRRDPPPLAVRPFCDVHPYAEGPADNANRGSGDFVVIMGVIGLLATQNSNARMKSIYEDRAVPLAQLFEINDRSKEAFISVRCCHEWAGRQIDRGRG